MKSKIEKYIHTLSHVRDYGILLIVILLTINSLLLFRHDTKFRMQVLPTIESNAVNIENNDSVIKINEDHINRNYDEIKSLSRTVDSLLIEIRRHTNSK